MDGMDKILILIITMACCLGADDGKTMVLR